MLRAEMRCRCMRVGKPPTMKPEQSIRRTAVEDKLPPPEKSDGQGVKTETAEVQYTHSPLTMRSPARRSTANPAGPQQALPHSFRCDQHDLRGVLRAPLQSGHRKVQTEQGSCGSCDWSRCHAIAHVRGIRTANDACWGSTACANGIWELRAIVKRSSCACGGCVLSHVTFVNKPYHS